MRLKAHPPAGLSIRIADQEQTSAPLQFKQGVAELTEEISW